MFDFIETKRLNIDSLTNENWNKFKCHRSKVSWRKKKIKFVVENVEARALGHLENVNTFCDNFEPAMAQLGKNYSPSNIYNLIVKRSLFFCQNKKVQIIQRWPCLTKLNKLIKGRLNTDTSPQNFWTAFLDNDLTEKFKKSTVASAIAIPLPLCFSCFIPLHRFRENLTKPFYFSLSLSHLWLSQQYSVGN